MEHVNSRTASFFTHLTTKKAIFILTILGFCIFSNALLNNFLWDDLVFLVNNSAVHKFDFTGLFTQNIVNSQFYYRPVIALYYQLLYSLFQDNVFFYHFSQISLHIVNSILLYLVYVKVFKMTEPEKIPTDMNTMSGSERVKHMRLHKHTISEEHPWQSIHNFIALFASIIFLIHPIQVESVVYNAAINSVLFFFFGIIALCLSLKKETTLPKILLISGLLLLSLFSKETGILFIFLVLLIRYFLDKRSIPKYILFIFLFGCIYFFLRTFVGKVSSHKYISHIPIPINDASITERILNMPAIFLYYLKTTIFPVQLAVGQEWIVKEPTFFTFYLPLMLIIALITAIIWMGMILKKQKNSFAVYIFFCTWFFSGIFIHLQFIPLDMTVADRWFYFPLGGLLGLIGVSSLTFIKHVHLSSKKFTSVTNYGTIFFIIIIFLFSVRTLIRNLDYRDQFTLFTKDAPIAHSTAMEDDLAVSYFSKGDMTNTYLHLQKSIAINEFADNNFHLGNYYEHQGNIQIAKDYYYKSLNMTEDYYARTHIRNPRESNLEIYTKLANILLQSNDYAGVEHISSLGVKYFPDSEILWKELAISANQVHDQKQAIAAAERVKVLSPSEESNFFYNTILSGNTLPSIIIPIMLKQNQPLIPGMQQ